MKIIFKSDLKQKQETNITFKKETLILIKDELFFTWIQK